MRELATLAIRSPFAVSSALKSPRLAKAVIRAYAKVARHVPVNRFKSVFITEALRLRGYPLDFVFDCRPAGVKWSARGFPDLLTRHMLFEGMYQQDVLLAIRRLARPGGVVLDVGGHHGLMAVVSGQSVGPSGRVFTFEPNPRAREHLTAHLRLNGIHNATIEEVALSDREGVADFYAQSGDVTWNSTIIEGFAEGFAAVDTIPIQTLMLDTWVERAGVVPTLIKIDVEGSEFLVLQGALKTLARHRPVLIMEFNPLSAKAAGHEVGEYLQFLREAGYRSVVLRRNRWGYYHFDDQEPFEERRHCAEDQLANVVCIPA
jgi:FkbM family methyltransferase